MNSRRIKEIQQSTPYPESVSVMLALKQVWNECEQDHLEAVEALRSENNSLKRSIHLMTQLSNPAGVPINLAAEEENPVPPYF